MTVIVRRKAPNPLKGSKCFKPGQSGNPKGRPVGSQSKLTYEWKKLQDVVASNLLATYDTIHQQALKGKEWAVKLELKLSEEGRTREIQHVNHDVGAESNAEIQIAGLLKTMAQFKFYTKEQLLNSLDTLVKIKNSSALEPSAGGATVVGKTLEEIDLELKAIEMLIQQKEKEEQRQTKAQARQECI